MPIISADNYSEWLKAALTDTIQINNDASIELARDNFFPNQYLQDIGTDGEPTGWNLSGMPERLVGHQILLSSVGTPAPTGNAKPSTLSRQTTSLVPLSQDFWDGNQPIVPGPRPLGKEGPKPEPPKSPP